MHQQPYGRNVPSAIRLLHVARISLRFIETVHQLEATHLAVSHDLQSRQNAFQTGTTTVYFRLMRYQLALCEQFAGDLPVLRSNAIPLRHGWNVVASHFERLADGGVAVDVLWSCELARSVSHDLEDKSVVTWAQESTY